MIFPVGIPGSGKSTWAKTMFGGKYAIVSSDEIRKEKWGTLRAAHDVTPEVKKERNEEVWDLFYRDLSQLLTHGMDCYADGTNLTSHSRRRLMGTAERAKADLHLILFDNVVQAEARNREREHDLIVPSDVMENFCRLYRQSHYDIFEHESAWYKSITVIGHLE